MGDESFGDEDFGEERANLYQKIGYLENRVERMEIAHTSSGLNKIALEVALQVEDLFAKHHEGGRTQRLARAQIIIREAMRANLAGEADWQYPNSVRNAQEPQTEGGTHGHV